jgi:hypothetical protein
LSSHCILVEKFVYWFVSDHIMRAGMDEWNEVVGLFLNDLSFSRKYKWWGKEKSKRHIKGKTVRPIKRSLRPLIPQII